MKILQIVPAITDAASGPSYSVVRLCDELIGQQSELELCSLKWAATDRRPVYNREFALFEPMRRLGVSGDMKRYVMRGPQSYDLIHVHGMWIMPGVYGAAAAARRRVPLVWSPRGSLSAIAFGSGSRWKPAFWHLLQRRALGRTRLFHATSAAEAQDIRNLGFSQPVATIPNGIDVPDIRREPAPEGRTLLFLGRIHPIKGIPLLLDAWRELCGSHPDWNLRIVGPGEASYVRHVRELASRAGLQRIQFLGAAFGAEKWRHYATADLFVLPTHSENFGIAVAESLACGTPVVTTRGAPWAGVVRERCGWWCEVGAAPLHDALAEAMAMPRVMLDTMGDNGKRWMQREFSWKIIATRMLQAYRWIADRGDRPAWIR